jgi:arsenate reductase (glutaredoxin)
MSITIYHNPRCSNSRGALALIRAAGIEPRVIDFLHTPPNRETLRQLAQDAGTPLRDLMRAKEAVYAELGLAQANDEALLDALIAHPVLLNRPIVVSPRGTRLCRPPEGVLTLLPG